MRWRRKDERATLSWEDCKSSFVEISSSFPPYSDAEYLMKVTVAASSRSITASNARQEVHKRISVHKEVWIIDFASNPPSGHPSSRTPSCSLRSIARKILLLLLFLNACDGVKQMVFIFISPASNTWLVSVLEYFEQCVHRELSAEDGILPTCIFTHRF